MGSAVFATSPSVPTPPLSPDQSPDQSEGSVAFDTAPMPAVATGCTTSRMSASPKPSAMSEPPVQAPDEVEENDQRHDRPEEARRQQRHTPEIGIVDLV